MNDKQHPKIDGPKTNILKSRDDPHPAVIEESGENEFTVPEGFESLWSKSGEAITPQALRERIEPWLTALFQSEHLSLLIGSGLTHAVHEMSGGGALAGMDGPDFTTFKSQLQKAADQSAKQAGRDRPNFEDKIRVANELLVGLGHLLAPDAEVEGAEELRNQESELSDEISDALDSFADSLLKAEREIVTNEHRDTALNYLVNFLMSPASRTGTRDRLQIFTTNYDRLIEVGAEVAGIHLIDRFVGSIAPILRSSRMNVDMHYNLPGIRGEPRYLEGVVRFTKLHGSLDWVNVERDVRRIGLPYGVESVQPYISAPGLSEAGPMDLLIYPNAAKDRETSEYPYVELFRDFAAAICRPNSTLITYGFSFGDEHIIRVIEDMLTIPSAHLVIIAHGDPMNRIMKTYEKVGRPAQVTLLLGAHLGALKPLVDRYLPKPAIDRTTFKMTELLKSRFGQIPGQPGAQSESAGEETDAT